MFRQGLRRCATAVSRTAVAAPLRLGSQRFAQAAVRIPQFQIISQRNLSVTSRLRNLEAESPVTYPLEDAPKEITRFDDLAQLNVNENLLSAITDDMGYETMTPVQAKTIVPALKGTDIVAQAKTGTGKTIAFLLPLIQRMLEDDPTLAHRRSLRRARSDDIRGIVLSPTRELALQIAVEARALVKNTGIMIQTAVGGTNRSEMLRRTRTMGCHLLIATPGRLNDLLQDDRSGIDAPNLSALVLDEADRMLDTGFEDELRSISDMLPGVEEKSRQTMLVSATIPDNVIRLARTMVRPDDFEFVQTIPENESLTHDRIPQHIVKLNGWNNVFPSLFELIERELEKAKENRGAKPFKAIVYFNTTGLVQAAGELGSAYRRKHNLRLMTDCIHSGLTQRQRSRAADGFRAAKSAILFSSDVTARGMDFPDVTHVIQVDTPRDRESYIHRLGRTGRQGKDGEGWLLITPSSVRSARDMLRGLPIKPNETLTCATADAKADEKPSQMDDTSQLYSQVNARFLETAYTSTFGAHLGNKAALAQELNDWVMDGWKWEQLPVVSASLAKNLAVPDYLLNIGGSRRSSAPRRERDDSGDAFDDMSRQIRRDDSFDRPPRRDSGRGFSGRGRDNSRGFSRGGYGGNRDGGFRRNSSGRDGRRGDNRGSRSSRQNAEDDAW